VRAHDPDRDAGRVRIPADFERPDKILAGLTARQLAILAVAAVVVWALYAATRRVLPVVAFGALALPIGAVAATLALGSMEGTSADRWVLAAWRHRSSTRRFVPAPDGVAPAPAFLRVSADPLPAPLSLPVGEVSADGILDLGADGVALVCRASAVTFSLRTPGEQDALVAAFARFLNSLADPVQILVRAEPIDLAPTIDALRQAAPGLAHPALEAAAKGHADFLADLATQRDLLRREVLLVLHQSAGDDAASRLQRRAGEAAAALGAAGVTLVVLDGHAAARCLSGALDSTSGSAAGALVASDQPVTSSRSGSTRDGGFV
jgi:PrgI family protein